MNYKEYSGKWIDYECGKNFPPQKEIVLFYSAGTYYPLSLGYWECSKGFVNLTGSTLWSVTHWMPLPPVPGMPLPPIPENNKKDRDLLWKIENN